MGNCKSKQGKMPGKSGKATAKKGKKAVKGRGKPSGKARKKSDYSSLQSYIHKIMKQVSPNTRISKKAMSCMNTMTNDLFNCLCSECARIVRYSKKQTCDGRTVQAAASFVLPGELASMAINEATKA